MDSFKEPKGDRRKKSDKRKEKYERNGGITQKHVRATEAQSDRGSERQRLRAQKY